MRSLLSPCLIEDETNIMKCKFCCFKCGDAGPVRIQLMMSRRAYAPGETIDMGKSKVFNMSTISVYVRVVLKQIIELQTTGKLSNSTRGEQKYTLDSKSLGPGKEVTLEDFKLAIPAVPPSFFGAKGSIAAKREPLRFTYELSLQAKAQSDGGHKVRVDIPILVSALPPTKAAILDASSANDNLTLYGNFALEKYAILDDRPCDTVAPVTGMEDGNGVITTSVNEGTNIYEPDDHGSNLNSIHYQPQVVTFPSLENNEEVKISPQPSTLFDLLGPKSREAAYNDLIESISGGSDSRLVVDKWVKKNSTIASTLTPDEFGGVISKVRFSFEQPVVARELTFGMLNTLTTKHISAALKASPFSKMEIVRVMAPYVSDPENKDIVLNSLYTFEQEEAKTFFST